jgi:hypothetical protein
MTWLLLNTTVPRKITKKQRVLDFAAARGWARIGEPEWDELRRALPDVSLSAIQQSGLPVDAPWCGVDQHTFEDLEKSLREFSAIYESRRDLRHFTRQQVIASKDRAKFIAARNTIDAETRARKAAMAEWMLIWLGDPALFPDWLNALKRPSQRHR